MKLLRRLNLEVRNLKVIFTYGIEDNSESLRLLMPESSEQKALLILSESPLLNRVFVGTKGEESILDEKCNFSYQKNTFLSKTFVKLTILNSAAVSKSGAALLFR